MKSAAISLNASAAPTSGEVEYLAATTEQSLPANPFVGLRRTTCWDIVSTVQLS